MSLNNAGDKIISSVKQNKKNIIIKIENESIRVSYDTYAELRLYKGKRLLNDTFKEIKRLEKLDKEITYCKRICLKTLRSEFDVRNRLLKREVDSKDIDYIILLLKKAKLIDNKVYIESLVNHLHDKLYGKHLIINMLYQKDIPSEEIKKIEFLDSRERSKLNELYPKIYSKYLKKNESYIAKTKTIKYLLSRGYSLEDIHSIKGERTYEIPICKRH